MAQRSLTRMEWIGISCLILMAGFIFYSRFLYPGTGRKFNRVKNELIKKATIVRSLRQEQMSGRPDRKVRELKKKVQQSTTALREAETRLATNEERDALGAKILQMAGLEGLMIRNYSRIKDKEIIKELTGSEENLQSACYRIILSGTFDRVTAFLKKIDEIPKMVTMRRLHIEMPEKDKVMQMEVWITF